MKPLFLLALLILVAGCSSQSQSIGSHAKSEAKAYEKISKQYSKGEDAVKEGEKLVSKGTKLVEAGQADLRKGENMVFQGNQSIQLSRGLTAPQDQAVNTAIDIREIQAQATDLDKSSTLWKQGVDKVKDGNKLIAKANKKINEGEDKIRQGRSKIDYGQSLLKKSEAEYSARRS